MWSLNIYNYDKYEKGLKTMSQNLCTGTALAEWSRDMFSSLDFFLLTKENTVFMISYYNFLAYMISKH